MFLRRRRPRGYDPLRKSQSSFLGIRALTLLILVSILIASAPKVLRMFGVGNTIQHAAAVLRTEGRGGVKVSLEGGELQRAEDGLRLYPGDRVETEAVGAALLSFFDGTTLRLDRDAALNISESTRGTEDSRLFLALSRGGLWIAVPEATRFTGSILRTLTLPRAELELPPGTEAVISADAVIVFAADGLGVELTFEEGRSAFIGEGQQFAFPSPEAVQEDLYAFRSPLDPTALQSTFTVESRRRYREISAEEVHAEVVPVEELPAALLLTHPPEGASLSTEGTVEVRGEFGKGVEQVRVNGYPAKLDAAARSFSLELDLPEEEEVQIHVEALDRKEIVLAELRRTVHRDIRPPEKPVITSPAKEGETYQTSVEDLVIEGSAPKDAVGIVVNDYKLQLFAPGDTMWRYLASTELGNFAPGLNTYEVYAIDASGNRSEAASVSIFLGEGTEGAEETKESKAGQEGGLQTTNYKLQTGSKEVPLRPGTVKVTEPTSGSSYVATKEEFSIYGTTSGETDSVSVNGYRLRLYEPGSTRWKYIASTKMGTMKEGLNTYEIIARDKEGKLLDRVEYEVTYNPD